MFAILQSQHHSVLFVHLFLVVPDGAASIFLQPGVVAASASVWANVVPHLHRWMIYFEHIYSYNLFTHFFYLFKYHLTFSFSIATKEMARPILTVTRYIILQNIWHLDVIVVHSEFRPLSSSNSANAMHIVLFLIRKGDVNHWRKQNNELCLWMIFKVWMWLCSETLLLFTIWDSVDVNASGCYICADQQSDLFPLKTQQGL